MTEMSIEMSPNGVVATTKTTTTTETETNGTIETATEQNGTSSSESSADKKLMITNNSTTINGSKNGHRGIEEEEEEEENLNLLPFKLLPGEKHIIEKGYFPIHLVVATTNERRVQGKLYITNFRFYFRSNEPYNKQNLQQQSNSLNSPNCPNSPKSTSSASISLNSIPDESSSSNNNNNSNNHKKSSSSLSSNNNANNSITNHNNNNNNSINNTKVSSNHHFLIIDVALGLIHRIEKLHLPDSQTQTYELAGILVNCKNGRKLKIFKLPDENSSKFERNVFDLLYKYAFPISNNMNYFAFAYHQAIKQQQELDRNEKSLINFGNNDQNEKSANLNEKETKVNKDNEDIDGWFIYDAEKEYLRQGISNSNSNSESNSNNSNTNSSNSNSSSTSNKKWRLSHLNKDYKFCETYPAYLVVPSCLSDKELELIAEFRTKQRLPVLSWLKPSTSTTTSNNYQEKEVIKKKKHNEEEEEMDQDQKTTTSNNEDSSSISSLSLQSPSSSASEGNVAIFRSSQPMCGMSGKRNYYDESYLKLIADLNEKNKILHILDARPYINALANCTTGGGYENDTKNYTNCRVSFMNIENIHTMRDSLGASVDPRGNSDFCANLETNSKWLEHLRLILDGAGRVVELIESNHSVLIHCSDGWDRTAQLTSLAMLVMDKYYRTCEGFQVLVEKEWLSFGHRFGMRMGHGTDKHGDQDRSPVFLQFIDCVWQIMQQSNKHLFEFTEKFLLSILDSMFTCQFGTFLMNSESERRELKNTTVSFWTEINSNREDYLNKDFVEYDQPIKFNSSTRPLILWQAYYFRYRETSSDYLANGTNGNANGSNGSSTGAGGMLNGGGGGSGSTQKAAAQVNSVGNLFENIAPNTLLSNGFKLFNHIKSNLRN